MLGLYGICRWRTAPRLALAGFSALVLCGIIAIHAQMMSIPNNLIGAYFKVFLANIPIFIVLAFISLTGLIVSSVVKEHNARFVAGFTMPTVIIIGLVLHFGPKQHELLGFIDVVIEDFGKFGWIPLYINRYSDLYTFAFIGISFVTIICHSRLLISKSSDWLRLSWQVVIPAVIVFAATLASFHAHSRSVDFTQLMDLTQLAVLATLMALCVTFQKSISPAEKTLRQILGGAAIGLIIASLLQIYTIPITYNHILDLRIIILLTLVVLGYLTLMIYSYLSRLYETELEESRQERLAAIGRLASITAHEIRNPLQAIRDLSQLLLSKSVDDEFKETAGVIIKEVDHLDIILKRLLDYSRELKLKYKNVNLSVWWNEFAPLADEMSSISKVNCILNEPPDMEATLDPEKIRQVVVNLLKNAVEASNEGGSIRLNLNVDKNELLIRIEDEGRGISHEDADIVFKEFHTTKMEGSGLGLPVSKRIVETHGGRISFDLSVKNGAAVEVVLPLAPSKRLMKKHETN